MNLVDVHCHLNHSLFNKDLENVLDRAKLAGLKAILVSGVNPPENRHVLELSKKYPLIKASLGIYPIDALGLAANETGLLKHKGKINLDEEFAFIKKNIKHVTAIGEVGMDFKWADKETYQEQADNFRKIIHFANEVNKPLVIHSRRAEKECLEILETEAKIPVDLHCFSGKKKLVKKAIELGYYFSIPANIGKSQHFQMVVQLTPITQLLTETDSPWLGPTDKRNEPSNVKQTVKEIAKMKCLSEEETAKQIWQNYQKVFC